MMNRMILRSELMKKANACSQAALYEVGELRSQLNALRRRPARFMREADRDAQQVEDVLAGTAALPVVRAVMEKLDEACIRKMDQASEAPRAEMQTPGALMPPYTAEMRTFDAGGVDALTAFKAELQALTEAARREAAEEKE